MHTKPDTIGLTDLLDEVSTDLDDFRKKHASDYGMKNTTLWWELERERLLVRHTPSTRLRTLVGKRSARRALGWFTAGSVVPIAVQTAVRFLAG